MILINEAWSQTLSILLPVAICIIVTLYIISALSRISAKPEDTPTNYQAGLQGAPGAQFPVAVLYVLGFLVGFAIAGCLMCRYNRECCMRCFRYFLVADILFLFLIGAIAILYLIMWDWGIYADFFTFVCLVFNFGVVGLGSLYFNVPAGIHRMYVLSLNVIMSVLFILTLGKWLILAILALIALADFGSQMTDSQLLAPFVLPTSVELLHATPKILYHVANIRLRGFDLMVYSLMMALISFTIPSIIGAFLAILSTLAMAVFVGPYVGKTRVRPLPLAFIGIAVLMILGDSTWIDYLLQLGNPFDYNVVVSI